MDTIIGREGKNLIVDNGDGFIPLELDDPTGLLLVYPVLSQPPRLVIKPTTVFIDLRINAGVLEINAN